MLKHRRKCQAFPAQAAPTDQGALQQVRRCQLLHHFAGTEHPADMHACCGMPAAPSLLFKGPKGSLHAVQGYHTVTGLLAWVAAAALVTLLC